MASYRPLEYPKLLYHQSTGQMRHVLSAAEEATLGPEWGLAQMDVKFRKTHPPIMPEAKRPPVFNINLPGEDE